MGALFQVLRCLCSLKLLCSKLLLEMLVLWQRVWLRKLAIVPVGPPFITRDPKSPQHACFLIHLCTICYAR